MLALLVGDLKNQFSKKSDFLILQFLLLQWKRKFYNLFNKTIVEIVRKNYQVTTEGFSIFAINLLAVS